MSNPRIAVASIQEARRLLASPNASDITSIISISDGGEMNEPMAVRKAAHADKLILFFDDLDRYIPLHHAPESEDVAKIIAFAKQIHGVDGECLIHCHAGISRSSAAAIIVRATWCCQEGYTQGTPRVIEEAITEIFSEFPNSFPNLLMVRLADELLCLNGELFRSTKWLMPAPYKP